MRILVHPHRMEVGGSQLNAIELADAVRNLGHEMTLYAPPGVLIQEVRKRGLEVVLAPAQRGAVPSPASAARLTRLARQRNFDVIHAYEWDATLDVLYGPGWILDIPVLSTVLSMVVPSHLPQSLPLVVGTNELYEQERVRRARTYLLEPPIDMSLNRAGIAPLIEEGGPKQSVRQRWGIPSDATLITLVGRLSPGLKISGVLEAIRAMTLLNAPFRPHLLVVGDGPERARVESLAREANATARHTVVTVAGQLTDPRPAYDAADIVLGMGSSILRGMAFSKPVIVQGDRGFWRILDEESAPTFRHQGWFGIGDGSDGAPLLAQLLEALMSSPAATARNGEFGYRLIRDYYSLDRMARELVGIYEELLGQQVAATSRAGQAMTTTYWRVRTEVSGAVRRVGGSALSALPGKLGRRFARPKQTGRAWS